MWRRRFAVTEAQWELVLSSAWSLWPILHDDERDRLVALAQRFMHHHRIEGARGVEVTTDMSMLIAAQACVLLLGWDVDTRGPLEPYARTGPVIVHPSTVVLRGPRPMRGNVGQVTTDSPERVGGLAQAGGPVLISWAQARGDARRVRSPRNVVIHEFAHQLDMYDGILDGVAPQVGDAQRRQRFVAVCARVHAEMTESASPVPRREAATDPGEFFAVVTEEFFGRPDELAEHHGDLFGVFSDLYRQDLRGRWT